MVCPPTSYLLALSIHATCFARIDYPEIFKYMTLKLKIKCIYAYRENIHAFYY